MFAVRSYPLSLILRWTLKFLVLFALLSAIPVVLHRYFHFDFIIIPWLPVALIGTALAFYLGFKNNASYERLWEARKIWGSIVNNSRSFTAMVNTYIGPEHADIKLKLIRRHIAWITALRYGMRQRREWEHNNLRDNPAYVENAEIEELQNNLKTQLSAYLTEEDLEYVLSKKNPVTHLSHLQMKELKMLNASGKLDDLHHVELGNLVCKLYDDQGMTERIKNYPFPRQYASLNFYYVWLFILLLPFGMFNEFVKLGEDLIWLNIPFCTIVSWVFYTMEMIGDYSENPFEGSFNDVPITDISKKIETDIMEMMDMKDLPVISQPKNGVIF